MKWNIYESLCKLTLFWANASSTVTSLWSDAFSMWLDKPQQKTCYRGQAGSCLEKHEVLNDSQFFPFIFSFPHTLALLQYLRFQVLGLVCWNTFLGLHQYCGPPTRDFNKDQHMIYTHRLTCLHETCWTPNKCSLTPFKSTGLFNRCCVTMFVSNSYKLLRITVQIGVQHDLFSKKVNVCTYTISNVPELWQPQQCRFLRLV